MTGRPESPAAARVLPVLQAQPSSKLSPPLLFFSHLDGQTFQSCNCGLLSATRAWCCLCCVAGSASSDDYEAWNALCDLPGVSVPDALSDGVDNAEGSGAGAYTEGAQHCAPFVSLSASSLVAKDWGAQV